MRLKRFLPVIIIITAILFMFTSNIFSMPPHPDIVEKYRKEGRLDELSQMIQSMRDLGMNNAPINGRTMGREAPTTGNNKVCVIIIEFSDESVDSSSTPSFYDSLFENGPGSDGFGWTQFYQQMSNDQLNLIFDVYGPYTASNTHDHYGQPDGGRNDKYPAKLVGEAVDLANPDVDYSQYDNDSDGNVDGVVIIHQGPGQESSGDVNDIWSHRWSLTGGSWWGDGTGPRNYDGVTIDDYSMQPEYNSSPGDSTVGVFIHEYGHVLGLPDLYDTNYSGTDGVGAWSVMAGGSWGGGGARPVPFLAWEKDQLGWINLEELISSKSKQSDTTEIKTSSIDKSSVEIKETKISVIQGSNNVSNDWAVRLSLGIVALLGLIGGVFVGVKKGFKSSITLFIFILFVLLPFSTLMYSCFDNPDDGDGGDGGDQGDPPSAPTGLTASDGDYTDHIELSWNSVSDADKYYYYYATSQSGTYTEFGNGSSTSIDVIGTNPGDVYWFKVKAENDYGLSGFSNADSGYIAESSFELTVGFTGGGVTANGDDMTSLVPMVFDSGELVTLVPSPDSGYTFDSWGGDDSSDVSDNGDGTYDITIDSDKTLIANFTGGSSSTRFLEDIELSYHAMKIELGAGGDQYYIIENKRVINDTWTQYLPGGGLLICHITDSEISGNDFNSGPAPHGVTVVEADSDNNAGELWDDGDFDNGSSTDPFYLGNNDSLTPTTTPDTDLNNGTPSGVSITNISGIGSIMSFDY